jgi:hypothetical protein
MKNSLTGFREVTVAFDNGADTTDGTEVAQIAAPIDSFKAALELVTKIEGVYFKLGAAGAPDLTDATVIASGALPFQIHVYTVSTVMATGTYKFIYVETKPNTEA